MENIYTSPYDLPNFSRLKKQREERISPLINNLKIAEVKKDNTYIETSERIKNSILLEKVSITAPQFVDYQYVERPLTMQQQFIGGGSKHHYIHRIEFHFTGDSELFRYAPESGFSFSSSDRGVILPDFNRLTVYVDLPELNPTLATQEAQSLLSMTLQFVNANNESVDSWKVSVTQRVEHELQQKRIELVNLFGS